MDQLKFLSIGFLCCTILSIFTAFYINDAFLILSLVFAVFAVVSVMSYLIEDDQQTRITEFI